MTSSQHPHVPYVTLWSEERTSLDRLVLLPDEAGIAYSDETLGDRDSTGLLWHRSTLAQGHGKPLFGAIHTARQRRAMRRLLCQVCGGPADRNDDGILWLLRDARGDWDGWPDGMGATEPPVCEPCVDIATRLCPALRDNHVVVRAGHAPLAGAFGWKYRPGPHGGPESIDNGGVVLLPTSPYRRWFLAVHSVRELQHTTLVRHT